MTPFGTHIGGVAGNSWPFPHTNPTFTNPAQTYPMTLHTQSTTEADTDGDGSRLCDVLPDCDDLDADRSPAFVDIEDDGIDNNCNDHQATAVGQTFCADNARSGDFPGASVGGALSTRHALPTNGPTRPVVSDGVLLYSDADGVYGVDLVSGQRIWSDLTATGGGGAGLRG